jgi:hypothetical protein
MGHLFSWVPDPKISIVKFCCNQIVKSACNHFARIDAKRQTPGFPKRSSTVLVFGVAPHDGAAAPATTVVKDSERRTQFC